jgi:acetyltransferase-like isoleucine patch superfamily enzyme
MGEANPILERVAPGLLVYDLLFLALATAAYGAAARAGAEAFVRLAPVLTAPFALVPAVVVALLALIAEVGVLSFLCPRLTPGSYPMMKGKVFFGWMLRSMLRRLLVAPGIKWAIYTSNVLRFLALRAMGARVAFTSNMSSDVDLLDPALLEVGAGAILGAKTFVSGHYIDRGQLVLAPVRIGARALLAAEVSVGPGVTVGAKAIVKPRAGLGPSAYVGDEAQIGGEALLDLGARVGERADLGQRVHVGVRAEVPPGAKVAPGETVTAG